MSIPRRPRLYPNDTFVSEATIMSPTYTRVTVTLDVVVPEGHEVTASIEALYQDLHDAASSRYLIINRRPTWETR